MGLRPANRSIETFDISLMAVVTKAMGAFLVLMLLLVPSYVTMPDIQRKLAGEEVATRALANDQAFLIEENRALERNDPSREQMLRQRIAELERENRQLAQRPGFPAMLALLSWAECDVDNIDFYITADGTGADWPDVRPGPQPLPPGVFEYPQAQLAPLLLDIADPGAEATDFVTRRAAKQRLWIIKAVRPHTSYVFYAKVRGLRGECDPTGDVLLTATDGGIFRSRAAPGVGVASSPAPFRILVKSERIVFLGDLQWDGKVLDLHLGLWRGGFQLPDEQKKLDERFGYHD